MIININGINYEIISTLYNHPLIKSGMHTNGPAQCWYKKVESSEWIDGKTSSFHKLIQRLKDDSM